MNEPPLIIWNHRWEHDKNPEAFFQALSSAQSQGADFRVALLGERYETVPAVFESARGLLGKRLVHCGHVASRQQYYQWLARGRIIISTALQENFGIAVIEAIRHGCLPLLPDRLSYPEILPRPFHADFLYSDTQELVAKLMRLIRNGADFAEKGAALAAAMDVYAWENRAAAFDEELKALAAQSGQAGATPLA